MLTTIWSASLRMFNDFEGLRAKFAYRKVVVRHRISSRVMTRSSWWRANPVREVMQRYMTLLGVMEVLTLAGKRGGQRHLAHSSFSLRSPTNPFQRLMWTLDETQDRADGGV